MTTAKTNQVTKKDFLDWVNNGTTQEFSLGGITGFQARRNKESITFRLRYFNEAGKKRYYKIGNYPGITYEIARKEASKKSSEKILGVDIQQVRQNRKLALKDTLNEYLDKVYLVTAQQQADGKAVIQGIKNYFPDLLEKPMTTIDRKYVSSWQAKLLLTELKPRTIRKHFNALKTVFNHAIQSGHLEANPLNNIKLSSMTESEEYRRKKEEVRRYLEPNEVEALFKGLNAYEAQRKAERRNSRAHGKALLPSFDDLAYTSYVRPFIELMFYTGLRPSDIRTLEWQHLNLQFKVINKVISKTSHKKSDKHTVPLSDSIMKVLKAWSAQNNHPRTGLVFPSKKTGLAISKTALIKPWAKIKELGGLPEELHLYTLRHHLPSDLIMKGASTMAVAKILGHSDTKMVEKHYGHLAPNYLHDLVNQLNTAVPQTESDM